MARLNLVDSINNDCTKLLRGVLDILMNNLDIDNDDRLSPKASKLLCDINKDIVKIDNILYSIMPQLKETLYNK